MEDSKGLCNCITVISVLIGLFASLVTIFTYFNVEAESLLQGVSQLIPRGSEMFGRIDDAITEFASRWSLGPALSAAIICVLIIILRIGAEFVFDLYTSEVEFSDIVIQFFAYLPLALAWIWLFSGVISVWGIVLLFVAYIVSILVSIVVSSMLADI
jgi:hypothetical protein